MKFLRSIVAVVVTATAALAEEDHINTLRGHSNAIATDNEGAKVNQAHVVGDKDIEMDVALRGSGGETKNEGNGHAHAHGHGNEKNPNGPDDQPIIQPAAINACPHNTADGVNAPCTADVVIVGGGVAGISAAAYLQRRNKKVIIVDARSDEGRGYGRVRQASLSGVKVDMGAEFIHTGKPWNWDDPENQLRAILTGLVNYDPNTYEWATTQVDTSADYLFTDYTWHDFFAEEVVGGNNLEKVFKRGIEIGEIRTRNGLVTVTGKGTNPMVFKAPKVIVAVPMTQLQQNKITFDPALNPDTKTAISNYKMGPAVKAFIETEGVTDTECFAVDYTTDAAFEMFYDEMEHRTDKTKHITGYFAEYGAVTGHGYVTMTSAEFGNKIGARIEEEDYTVLGGVGTNWSDMDHIKTGYTKDCSNADIRQLQTDHVFGYFAGEAIPAFPSWGGVISKDNLGGHVYPDPSEYVGFVPGAVGSGKHAAKKVLGLM